MRKTFLKVLLFALVLITIGFLSMVKKDIPLDILKKKYATPPSTFLKVMDMDVHYRKQGMGHNHLVLLHGTGASLHTWEGWIENLNEDFTIHSFDLPAFGLTGPSPDRNYSIDSYVAFVDELTKVVGIDSFALAGNSLGGGIAWQYTLKHPDKVTHLILIDASGYPQIGRGGSIFRMAKIPLLKSVIKYITPKSMIEKNLKEVYANQEKVTEKLISRYHDLVRRKGNRQAFIDRIKVQFDDRSDQIKNIRCPTLIMWGAQDFWITLDNAKKFEKDIPGSNVIIYPDLGHVPMEENPDITAQDVKAFILGIKEVTI